MQNTVVQHNALNLSSSAYMNSTTKFVKVANIDPSLINNTKNQTIISVIKSVASADKIKYNQQKDTEPPIYLKPNQSKIPQIKQPVKTLHHNADNTRDMQEIQIMAMTLSASIFMNSTTKFVKGFSVLPISNKQFKKEAKGSPRGKKHRKIQRDMDSRSSSPSTFIKQKTPEKIGLQMTATNYMNSTTKYLKKAQQSIIDPQKGKIQKIINTKRSRSSNRNSQQNINRMRFKSQNQITGQKINKNSSPEDCDTKRYGRKQKVRQIKFGHKKQNQQSSITLKQNQIKSEPNLKVIQKISVPTDKLAKNSQAQAIEKHTSNPPNDLKANRINRKQAKQVREIQPKLAQAKEEPSRPFTRQSNPQTNYKRSNNENIRQSKTSILQKIADIKEDKKQNIKSPNSFLPLQTPIKQFSQNIGTSKSSENVLIKTQNQIRKTGVYSPKNTKNNYSNQDEILIQTRVKRQPDRVKMIETLNMDQVPSNLYALSIYANDLAKKKSVGSIGHDNSSQVTQKKYPPKITNNNLKNLKKEQQKNESTIVISPRRSTINVQDKHQNPKNTEIKNKIISSPVIPSNQQANIASAKTIKSEPTQNLFAKNPIQISSLKNKPIINRRSNISSQSKQIISTYEFKSPNINNNIKQVPISSSNNLHNNLNTATSKPTNNQQIVKNKSESKNTQSLNVINQQQNHGLNKKQSEKQIQKVSNNLTQKVQIKQNYVKYSKILFHSIIKLYKAKLQPSLLKIKQASLSSKLHRASANIISLSIINIFQSLKKTTLKLGFNQLKKIVLVNLITSKTPQINSNKQIESTLIFRVLLSKYRSFFLDLKNIKTSKIQVQITNKIYQQPIQKQDSSRYINQMVKIVERDSFNKLFVFAAQPVNKNKKQNKNMIQAKSPPKNTKPPRNYQLQKTNLYQVKQQLQKEVSLTESKITDKKRYSDIQKSKLLKKQSELSKKVKQADEQALQRRKKNKELKNKIDEIAQQHELDISLPEYEPLVGILTEIYSYVFGNTSDKINIQVLRKKYEIKQEINPLLKEWQILRKNVKLKNEISKWQGILCLTNSQSSLLNENLIVSKILRNYIRERYLWQYVKISAQKL